MAKNLAAAGIVLKRKPELIAPKPHPTPALPGIVLGYLDHGPIPDHLKDEIEVADYKQVAREPIAGRMHLVEVMDYKQMAKEPIPKRFKSDITTEKEESVADQSGADQSAGG